MKLRKKLKSFQQKYWLFLVIILLIVAPIFINIGLIVTDYYYQKTGNVLTAVGLTNENWLEFWKDYISIAIAFFGIYLVWDSSNKDRKKQYNRELAEQYLHTVSQEEKQILFCTQVKCGLHSFPLHGLFQSVCFPHRGKGRIASPLGIRLIEQTQRASAFQDQLPRV